MSSEGNVVQRNPMPVDMDNTDLAADIAAIHAELADNQAYLKSFSRNESDLREIFTLDPNLLAIFGSRSLVANDRLMVDNAFTDVELTSKLFGANSEARMDCRGFPTVTIQITGTWAGTLTFEATSNGSDWVGIGANSVAQTSIYSGQPTIAGPYTTVNGLFRFNTTGLAAIRVRYSTYTATGTVAVLVHFRASRSNGAPQTTVATVDYNISAAFGGLAYYSPIARATTIAPTAQPVQTSYVNNFLASFPQIQPRLRVEIGGDQKLPIAQQPNTLELKVIAERTEHLLEEILFQLTALNDALAAKRERAPNESELILR